MAEQLNVLYEDRDILVAVKPEGVDSEASRGLREDMVNLIRNHIAETERAAGNAGTSGTGAAGGKAARKNREGQDVGVPYVGVIQRLDRPVRGVMVFAKTKEAAAALSKDLQEGKIQKKYRAILCGQPKEKSGALTDYLVQEGKEKGNVTRVGKKNDKGAKEARLRYTVLRKKFLEGQQISEVEIELLTGRHHQIRVQFAAIGCPLMGDRKYNPAYQDKPPRGLCGSTEMGQHLCLTAVSLSFIHPKSRKAMKFQIEPLYFL